MCLPRCAAYHSKFGGISTTREAERTAPSAQLSRSIAHRSVGAFGSSCVPPFIVGLTIGPSDATSIGAIDAYAAGKKKQDARFTSSGYGLSDQDPVPVSFRERLMARSYLVNNEAPITEFNLKTTANASQGKGGTCNGDSGGPIFFQGTRTIVAVTSFGMNPQCKGLDFSYRLDRAEVLAWINPNRPDAG